MKDDKEFYKKYPEAIDIVKFFKEAICKKPKKPVNIPITSEEFEDILEDARSDKRK